MTKDLLGVVLFLGGLACFLFAGIAFITMYQSALIYREGRKLARERIGVGWWFHSAAPRRARGLRQAAFLRLTVFEIPIRKLRSGTDNSFIDVAEMILHRTQYPVPRRWQKKGSTGGHD